MSLRLLVDEDSQDHVVVRQLREAGHDVLTVNEAGIRGRPDTRVFETARALGRCMLTRNGRDFEALHEAQPDHPGVLVVYRYEVWAKNMEDNEIVRAIANVEASGWELAGQFVVLNAWNYEPPVSRS